MGLASASGGALAPAAASRASGSGEASSRVAAAPSRPPTPFLATDPVHITSSSGRRLPMTTITIAARYARYLLTSLATVAFGMAVN